MIKKANIKICYVGPAFNGKATNVEYLWKTLPESLRISRYVEREHGKTPRLANFLNRIYPFMIAPPPPLIKLAFRGPAPSEKQAWLDLINGETVSSAITQTVYDVQTITGIILDSVFGYWRERLRGSDGLVYIWDEQAKHAKSEMALERLFFFTDNIEEEHGPWGRVPWVFQRNKCDLKDQRSAQSIKEALHFWPQDLSIVDASAVNGTGVWDTFLAMLERVAVIISPGF